MRIDNIRQLATWMADAGLTGVELKTPAFEIRLRRAGTCAVAVQPPAAAVAIAEPLPQRTITATGCGHFFARHPARDSAQVSPGQAIKAGDAIGVLAVGELLLPALAALDGVAGEYLVEDGQLVDYGKPLLALTGA